MTPLPLVSFVVSEIRWFTIKRSRRETTEAIHHSVLFVSSCSIPNLIVSYPERDRTRAMHFDFSTHDHRVGAAG